MLSGPNVILALKTAVVAVTILLLTSLVAVARGNYRLHGRINVVFFVLTLTALLSLETLIRFVDPQLFSYFDSEAQKALRIHLCFAVPSAALLPLMLFTGLTHRRTIHLFLATIFGVLWTGTFITGVFYLPGSLP